MATTNIEKLKENIIQQAKYYQDQYGEFYPFGAIINNKAVFKPLSVYWGNDNPDSIEVIENLEKGLLKGIKKGEYVSVAIGVDVLTFVPYSEEKMDALEIRIDDKKEGCINFYMPYKILDDGGFKYFDVFSKEGTLNLFSK